MGWRNALRLLRPTSYELIAPYELKFGKDIRNQHLAREIIASQRREINEMREWLKRKNIPQP